MDRDDTRDPDSPPSAEELAEAGALRDALDGATPNADADFARAVSLAHAPRALSPEDQRAIAAQGIARGEARRAHARRQRGRVATLVAGGLALAAGIALVAGQAPSESARVMPAAAFGEPLVPVRSTQPLFREPFARTGGESARIDRIASARAADLRDNRFAAWGVR